MAEDVRPSGKLGKKPPVEEQPQQEEAVQEQVEEKVDVQVNPVLRGNAGFGETIYEAGKTYSVDKELAEAEYMGTPLFVDAATRNNEE